MCGTPWTRNGAQNLNFATPTLEVLGLNASLPLKRWKTQPGKRVALLSPDKRKNAPEEESSETVGQLKQVLQKATGEEITVIVQQKGASEKFSFKVPPDLIRLISLQSFVLLFPFQDLFA